MADRPFLLRVSLESAIEQVAPLAHRKGLELAVLIYEDVPEPVTGDEPYITRTLIEGVAARIESAPPGNLIVRVMLIDEDDRECRVRLSVTGEETADRPPCGTNSRPASDEATSSPAAFEVRLRKDQRQPVTQRRLDARVLLYDANRYSRLAVCHRLRARGLAVDTPTSEGEFEAHLIHPGPGYAAVILGFGPRDATAGHMRRRIQQSKNYSRSPIIALLSSSDRAKLDTACSLGADVALSKPVTTDSLMHGIERLLNSDGSRNHRDRAQQCLSTDTPPWLQGLKILLADDSEIGRRLIARLVTECGAEIQLADDGRQALGLISRCAFDLILMRLQMPVMSGLEASRLIRQKPTPGKRIPIIGLSVDTEPASVDHALASGMDGVLGQPVTRPQLWRAIQGVLNGTLPTDTLQGRCDRSAAEAQGDATPARDIEAALNVTGGDRRLADQLFSDMLSELPEKYRRLQQCVAKQDWEELAKTAHHLCGSVTYCGVPALEQSVRALERLAQTADAHRIHAALLRLDEQIKRLSGG